MPAARGRNIMSSPPKTEEAEVVPSPTEDIEVEKQPMDEPGQGLEVEVKEQDRWLPIANGMCRLSFLVNPESLCFDLPFVAAYLSSSGAATGAASLLL